MTENATQEIELDLETAKQRIRMAETLDRLFANPDFQAIISKGYFEGEAVRLVHLKGAPPMQEQRHQDAITKEIDGIGCLKGYFSAIYHQADNAQGAIDDYEAALEEMHNEEGEA